MSRYNYFGCRFENCKHCIVPAEADIVRQIFEDCAAGLSPARIAKKLNDVGIPSPLGSVWMGPSIRKIIKKERYTGVGGRPVIIERSKFLEAQDRLRQRARKPRINKPFSKHFYGYRYEDGGYHIVPGEAAIVRQIFTDYTAGCTCGDIADKLNASGIASPAGASWRDPTVARILREDRYTGKKGCPIIIDSSIHMAARRVATQNPGGSSRILPGRKSKHRPYSYYGYSKRGDSFYIVEDEASVIRQIYAYYLAGHGYNVIAKKLSPAGTPSPNGSVGATAIGRILLNEEYAGTEDYPAIIDRATFDAAQSIRGQKAKTISQAHRKR